jgi:hypothetical protein
LTPWKHCRPRDRDSTHGSREKRGSSHLRDVVDVDANFRGESRHSRAESNRQRRKLACYAWSFSAGGKVMLCEASVRSTTWVWAPIRGLRASERENDALRVHKALKRIAKARAALDAEEAAALRDAQRMQLWREFGYASLIEYMERELLYTPRAAVERLRVANVIEELPEIEAALQQGALSFSGARELSRVVTPETQQAWLDAVQDKNVRQIEELVSGHKRGDTPADPVDEARTRVLRFEVTEATAAIVRHYQKLRTKQMGQLIDDDLVIREAFQLALDKVVEERQRTRESEEPTPSSPTESARPRYQHAVVTCDRCKRGWLDAAGTRSLLSAAQLECARCDSDDIGHVDAAGPVRKRSKIPPATRRKVLARDGHRCRVPGCRSTNIDVHHLHPFALGGSHDEANLLTLCEGHHLAVHSGKLTITGTAPDVRFEFAKLEGSASRFDIEARAIETQGALEQLGFKRPEAIAAVRAARTHVGTREEPIEVWLKAALDQCRELVT